MTSVMQSEFRPELLNECDKEPIHLLGGVQPHGVMVVVDADGYRVQRVSANVEAIFGLKVDDILGKSLLGIIAQSQRKELQAKLSNTAKNYANPIGIALKLPEGRKSFDCIGHAKNGNIILEFENPNDHAPSYSIGVSEHYELTQNCLAYISDCDSVANAARYICQQVRTATDFDRVMFYRFADDGHGEVVGEAKREDLEPFLGLHYPATDIPKQARILYSRNWIRLIQDVDAQPVALAPQSEELIDMSDCVLRSVSPVHIQYLKNMGVRASMSVSLMNGQELWGLIACHHYAGPKFVPYTNRLSCVYLAQLVSAQMITKLKHEKSERVGERRHKLITLGKKLGEHDSLKEALSEHGEEVLNAVKADGFVLQMEDELVPQGLAPNLEFFSLDLSQTEHEGSAYYSHSIRKDFPSLEKYLGDCAGMAVLPLGTDWRLFFFRQERVKEIRWAGKPDASEVKPLTPRNSFEEWKETVNGQSEPWTEADISIIEDFQTWLVAFIIQRNNQLATLNAELLAKNDEIEQFTYTVSHDLKSPLVTIKAFAGALKDDINQQQYDVSLENLNRIQRASDRMATFIEELLAFSRIGRQDAKSALIDMDALVKELLTSMEQTIRATGVTVRVQEDLPDFIGCRSEIFRLFQNLLENALAYGIADTDPEIEIRAKEIREQVRFSVKDNGPGIDEKYHTKIFKLFQRLDSSQKGSGVGLASVVKIVQRHKGTYGVKSKLGSGAEFWVKFPVNGIE